MDAGSPFDIGDGAAPGQPVEDMLVPDNSMVRIFAAPGRVALEVNDKMGMEVGTPIVWPRYRGGGQ